MFGVAQETKTVRNKDVASITFESGDLFLAYNIAEQVQEITYQVYGTIRSCMYI